MAMTNLETYIKIELDLGTDPDRLLTELLIEGGNEHEIESAIQRYYTVQ